MLGLANIRFYLLCGRTGGQPDIRPTNSTMDVHGTTESTLLFGIPFG
jgi:hypothetical protein